MTTSVREKLVELNKLILPEILGKIIISVDYDISINDFISNIDLLRSDTLCEDDILEYIRNYCDSDGKIITITIEDE